MSEPVSNQTQMILRGYKHTDVGIIPKDWSVISVKSLCKEIFLGLTSKVDYVEHNGVPLIRATDIAGGILSFGKAKKISLSQHKKLTKYRIAKKGDILVSKSGSLGVCALVNTDKEFSIYESIIVLQPSEKLDPLYLLSLLRFQDTQYRMVGEKVGSSVAHLNIEMFRELDIPIPDTLNEQKLIGKILFDVDILLTELEQLIAKKQAIKTATMQQLLTGKTRLPPFATHTEGEHQGQPKGMKSTELGEIPEDWEVVSYDEIFSFLSTSTNSRADLSNEGDYGYIHYGDIHTKWNNRLDLENYELPKISQKIVSSAFVKNGDVIMADASEDYDGVGKSVEVLNIGSQKVVSGLHTFLLRDKEKLLADGYRGYLHTIPVVKLTFDRLATGMKVFGISKNNLTTILIPVPCKEEQTAIANVLSDMDAEIQALEQRLAKTRQIKQGMMQELLTGKTRLPVEVDD